MVGSRVKSSSRNGGDVEQPPPPRKQRQRRPSKLVWMSMIFVGLYLAFWMTTSRMFHVKEQQQHQHQLGPNATQHNQFHNVLSASKQTTTQTTPDDDDDKPFISYQMVHTNTNDNRPYNLTFGYFTKCYLGVKTNKHGRKPIRRVPLAPPLERILGTAITTVRTNLKIIMVGDSVGMQFHQLLEEAAGATWNHRTLYQFAWGAHESVSVAAPVEGGGVLGAFRMTGMLLEAARGKAPPNAGGGGWLPEHVKQLLTHTYYDQNDKHRVVREFDSMIFRIPHGWLKLNEITAQTLTESLHMAHALFGIQTAVLLTLPLNNNIQTNANRFDVGDGCGAEVTGSTTTINRSRPRTTRYNKSVQ
jgi:hypothetical protein